MIRWIACILALFLCCNCIKSTPVDELNRYLADPGVLTLSISECKPVYVTNLQKKIAQGYHLKGAAVFTPGAILSNSNQLFVVTSDQSADLHGLLKQRHSEMTREQNTGVTTIFFIQEYRAFLFTVRSEQVVDKKVLKFGFLKLSIDSQNP